MTHPCLASLKYLEAMTLPKEDKLDPNLDSQYLWQKHLPLPKGLTNRQKIHCCAALQHIDQRTPTATLTHCNTPKDESCGVTYCTVERQFLTPGIFTSPEIQQQWLFPDFLEERFAELLTQALNDEIAHQTLEGLTIEDIENIESMPRMPSPPPTQLPCYSNAAV